MYHNIVPRQHGLDMAPSRLYRALIARAHRGKAVCHEQVSKEAQLPGDVQVAVPTDPGAGPGVRWNRKNALCGAGVQPCSNQHLHGQNLVSDGMARHRFLGSKTGCAAAYAVLRLDRRWPQRDRSYATNRCTVVAS